MLSAALEQRKIGSAETPLRLTDIWAFRVRLQIAESTGDLALFSMAIDSKLRLRDIAHGCVLDSPSKYDQ